MGMNEGLGYTDVRGEQMSEPFLLVHVDRFGQVRDDQHGLLGVFGDVRQRRISSDE